MAPPGVSVKWKFEQDSEYTYVVHTAPLPPPLPEVTNMWERVGFGSQIGKHLDQTLTESIIILTINSILGE